MRTFPSISLLAIALFVLVACGAEEDADRDREASSPASETTLDSDPGDLSRFVGEYGTAESEAMGRTIWVLAHCDGHLVSGATWGDASIWHLDEESPTTFVQRVPEGQAGIRLEFTPDEAGEVAMLRLTYDGRPLMEDPELGRLRESPGGFEADCWDGNRD